MIKHLIGDPSLRIWLVGGVPVRAHLSVIVLPLWAAYMGWVTGPSPVRGALHMILYIAGIYGLGVLHEFGHIVPARLFGASIAYIRLSGVGIFVRVQMKEEINARQDLIIALAGLLVSAILSVVLCVVAWKALGTVSIGTMVAAIGQQDWLSLLLLLGVTNVLLTLFNLLPVFPMDGGRILSALLAHALAPARAVRLVSRFGQVLAVATVPTALLLTGALYPRLLAVLTAGFIFWVSMQANRTAEKQVPAHLLTQKL